MTEERIEISDKILEAEVLAERVRVLSSDLSGGYFGLTVDEKKDQWRVTGHYYENARVKMEIIAVMAYDLKKLLNAIQDSI